MAHSCYAASHVAYRKARQSLGRSTGEGLDRRGHEAGLEDHLSVRKQVSRNRRDMKRAWLSLPVVVFALIVAMGRGWQGRAAVIQQSDGRRVAGE